MPPTDVIGEDRIEVADAKPLRAKVDPAVEDPTHEVTVLLGCHREVCNLVRFRIDLDARDKLKVPNPQPDQEVIEWIGW